MAPWVGIASRLPRDSIAYPLGILNKRKNTSRVFGALSFVYAPKVGGYSNFFGGEVGYKKKTLPAV